MIKDSSEQNLTKFSRRLEVSLSGACATSHPSFQAAVPLYKPSAEMKRPYDSAGILRTGSQSAYRSASSYRQPSLERNYSVPAKYETSFVNVTTNYDQSSAKESYRKNSPSHYINSTFMQVKPVASQFPDRDTLPESMEYMSISDQIVSFYPVHKKGGNYLKYCAGWLADEEKPRSRSTCIFQYTSGSNWYCTEVNMALAADSPKLKSYGTYIKQLKYSIGMSPMTFSGTVFRGADMSPDEIHAYETKDLFFIPSFTSTSKSMPFQGKNTLFHIEISPEWSKFCMEILSHHTKYDEEEILFSCYNLYRYIRTEKSNGQRILKLQLVNYDKYFDYETNTILN